MNFVPTKAETEILLFLKETNASENDILKFLTDKKILTSAIQGCLEKGFIELNQDNCYHLTPYGKQQV